MKIKQGCKIYYDETYNVGALIGLVPKSHRKDSNIIMIVDQNGNAKRVSGVAITKPGQYIDARTISKYLNLPFEELELNSEVKKTVENNPTPLQAWETTDGKLFDDHDEAYDHQLHLDFREWGQVLVHSYMHTSRTKLWKFIVDNREELQKFIDRIRVEDIPIIDDSTLKDPADPHQ